MHQGRLYLKPPTINAARSYGWVTEKLLGPLPCLIFNRPPRPAFAYLTHQEKAITTIENHTRSNEASRVESDPWRAIEIRLSMGVAHPDREPSLLLLLGHLHLDALKVNESWSKVKRR